MPTDDYLDELGVPVEFRDLMRTEVDDSDTNAQLEKSSSAMADFFHQPIQRSATGDALAAQVEAEAVASKMCGSELTARNAIGSLTHLDAIFARPTGLAGDLYDFDLAKAQEAAELHKADGGDSTDGQDEAWDVRHPELASALATVTRKFAALKSAGVSPTAMADADDDAQVNLATSLAKLREVQAQADRYGLASNPRQLAASLMETAADSDDPAERRMLKGAAKFMLNLLRRAEVAA